MFLFQSTVIVEKTVQDLMNLMHDLSAYSDQFLNMVCVKLQEYKDTCTLAYRYRLGNQCMLEILLVGFCSVTMNRQELLLDIISAQMVKDMSFVVGKKSEIMIIGI